MCVSVVEVPVRKNTLVRLLWVGLAAGGATATALAGPGVWTTTGPEGGEVPFLVADAGAPGTLIAASRGGLFRSVDGATTWQRFENGLLFDFPRDLQMSDSGSTAFVVLKDQRLYRSSAGGDWAATALAIVPGDVLTEVSLRGGSDQFLAVASIDGLQLSSNGGATFTTPTATGLPATAELRRVEYASSMRLFAAFADIPAGHASPVFRSDDSGATWSATGALPTGSYFLQFGDGDLESAPSDPSRLYFSASNGVFVSVDAGDSWAACGAGVGAAAQIVVESADPDVLWVATREGIFSSTDACAHWTPHINGLNSDGVHTDRIEAIALSPGFPGDGTLWASGQHSGVYRSSDSGALFVPANNGLVASNIRAIAMHPVDANAILLGYGDAFDPSPALYRSSDGGATWPRSNAGLTATQLRDIRIDPTTAGTTASTHVYAVGSSLSSSALADGGIYKSTDGGANWSIIDTGLPIHPIEGVPYAGNLRTIALDPRSCASPPITGDCVTGPLQTAYVTASGMPNFFADTYDAARVYKSVNAGVSWTASDTGLPAMPTMPADCFLSQFPVPLVVDPANPQTLYLGIAFNRDFAPPCSVPTTANGVFKSTDGGASWTHSSNGFPRLGGAGSSHWNVLALAIDPNDTDTLYAGAYQSTPDRSFDGRVLKSTDGGANWSDISVGIAGADVRAILVDPADSNTVYAGTGGGSLTDPSGIYRSTDGGLTWISTSIGLPADAATALAVDPHDPDRLLAGTAGGLWEFTRIPDADSDGASTTVEAAAPNGGDANGNGVPDGEEASVASFFGVNAATTKAGKGAPLPAVTISVTPLAGTCDRINNAHALDPASLPADTARGVAPALFERGVLRFELPDCLVARVNVQFHGADYRDVDWQWRNYGPQTPGDATSFDWYTFVGARKVAADTWELTLDNLERGNYRGDGNSILFVGAPGFVDIHLFGDAFE